MELKIRNRTLYKSKLPESPYKGKNKKLARTIVQQDRKADDALEKSDSATNKISRKYYRAKSAYHTGRERSAAISYVQREVRNPITVTKVATQKALALHPNNRNAKTGTKTSEPTKTRTMGRVKKKRLP